jgi:hypothetical protein
VDIDYASGVKKIIVSGAKTQWQDNNVIDSDVLQLKNMLDDMGEDSTIRGATLGENIKGSTFSALAMLSSAGKLPMIDPQEAVEQAFTGVFLHILDRIKKEGIDNTLIASADIPEDVEVVVTIEAKLPQDNLRNSQVAASLGDKVSDEWIHTNLLQINNTEEMHRQIGKEMIVKAMLSKIAQDPQYIDIFIRSALGMPTQPPAAPVDPNNPEAIPNEAAPGGAGDMTPEQAAMMSQGGVEAMPQGGPMIPLEERM